MKIKSILADEFIVPAKTGSINSPSLDRPLHKLPVAGEPGWSRQFDELPKCILRMELTDGTLGLGESYRDHDWAIIENISRRLIGQEIEQLVPQKLPIPRSREADAFECAVWDAKAKLLGVRIVDLLGGAVRERVKVSAWSGHRTINEIGPLAKSFAERGFACLKLKCDLEDDVVAWCQEIRRTAPGMNVILDPNERWASPFEARKRVGRLAEVGNVLCVEDPIPRWMLHEYARLREFSSVPIALHVALPYFQDAQRMTDAVAALRADAVDVFNFNGGIADFQRLDHIAAVAGVPCWHGSEIDLGILEAMYLHCCAAAQSCIFPSDVFGRLIRTHDMLAKPLEIDPPYAVLPDGAGLGVELDEDALEQHRTEQHRYP